MKIFSLNKSYPLFIPQVCFIDKYNNTNALVEMNPSIFITKEGEVSILIRCVNYIKFHDKKFTMFENVSKTEYYLLSGNIEDKENLDIENFNVEKVNYDYLIPTYPTFWKGLEDIRFVSQNKIIVTIPQCNPSGNPIIFNATINKSNISDFVMCYPNIVEKNWMPYYDSLNNEKVIYSLNPFCIKNIIEEPLEKIELTENLSKLLEGYHGSTNGIIFENNEDLRLFLIHVNRDKTYHRWLLFNVKTNEISLSEEFIFFKNTYIEFTCSLCEFKERIFISIGINDNKAFILETDINSIKSCLFYN